MKFSDRVLESLARVMGGSKTFWVVLIWIATWVVAMTFIIHGIDPYPFSFALFLTNIVQFLGLFILQHTQNRQSDHLTEMVKKIGRMEQAQLEFEKKIPALVAQSVTERLKTMGYF